MAFPPHTLYVGKVSYSAYLFHLFGIGFVSWLFRRVGVESNSNMVEIVRLFLNVVTTTVIASLSHQWLEIPSIAPGKRILTRWLPS